MVTVLKPAAGLLLALMLVVTGQSMVVARGAAAATGQIEICIGAEIVKVYVDRDGQPTQAPHICPDCVLSFAEGAPALTVVPLQAVCAAVYHPPHSPADIVRCVTAGFWSRAPPFSV